MIYCDVCKKNLKNSSIINYKNMNLCCKHYQQKIKFGHFLDNNKNLTNDINYFTIKDNKVFIYLSSKNNIKAIIDLEDIKRIIIFKWRYWKNKVFTGKFKPIEMSNIVLNNKNNLIIHINNNPLDNRKCNLKISKSQ